MQAHSLEQVQTAIRNAQAAGDARAVAALKDYEEDIKRDIAMLRALAPREEAGVIENITSGIGAGAVGTGEIALLGGATLLEEEAELAAREKIKAGMIFTIEPMINIGKYETKTLNDGWTAVTKDKSLSAQFEHTIGVTKDGYEIFTLSKNK